MTKSKIYTVLMLAIATLLVMAIIETQPVHAKQKETKVKFPLYVTIWADEQDIPKVKLTGYYYSDKISYTVYYESFHKTNVKAYLLFPPHERSLFDSV